MTVGVNPPSTGTPVQPDRSRHRWGSRWSVGHLAVALAAVLAFVANLAFLRSADDTVAVVTAGRAIEAGDVIGPGDLTTTRIAADAGVLATLLTSLEGMEGRVAARRLMAGELVGAGDLLASAAPSGLASMALPIDPAHAAGGMIRPGDRVDLIDVQNGVGRFVARDVPVLTAPSDGSGPLGSSGRYLVVGVSEDQVLAVAEAIDDGHIDVVVTTGAAGG